MPKPKRPTLSDSALQIVFGVVLAVVLGAVGRAVALGGHIPMLAIVSVGVVVAIAANAGFAVLLTRKETAR